MRYQRVEWHHESPDEPVVLYAEMDDDGWEQRKVDEFLDGRSAWADSSHENLDTRTCLGTMATPPLTEINAQAEFEGAEISEPEFEAVWTKAIASSSSTDIQ